MKITTLKKIREAVVDCMTFLPGGKYVKFITPEQTATGKDSNFHCPVFMRLYSQAASLFIYTRERKRIFCNLFFNSSLFSPVLKGTRNKEIVQGAVNALSAICSTLGITNSLLILKQFFYR